MFARLKKWLILSGGSVDSIEIKEMELDAAMALQNLNDLDRLGLMHLIPARPQFAPSSHIITPDLEPSLKIPKSVSVGDAKFPAHLVRFHGALSAIVPQLAKMVIGVPGHIIFTSRVSKRGENLFVGGNVLQIQAEQEGLDVWRVRFSVGASMKAWRYQCWARLRSVEGVLASCCECKNGLACLYILARCFWVSNDFLFFFSSKRAGFCAHLAAGLRMLVKWINEQNEVTLVREVVYCRFPRILTRLHHKVPSKSATPKA